MSEKTMPPYENETANKLHTIGCGLFALPFALLFGGAFLLMLYLIIATIFDH